MKVCYVNLIILFVLFFSSSSGQSIQRNNGETAEQFVKRLKPANSTITHKIISTKWNSDSAIIAFYDQAYKLPLKNDPGQEEYHRILAVLYIQTSYNIYKKITIDTIDAEGGDPNIETVFFANADQDDKKELIIIASWLQRHYDVNGTLYDTFVYNDIENKSIIELNYLKHISKKLSGGCECDWSDGTSKKAKFKTAKEIRAALVQFGYK